MNNFNGIKTIGKFMWQDINWKEFSHELPDCNSNIFVSDTTSIHEAIAYCIGNESPTNDDLFFVFKYIENDQLDRLKFNYWIYINDLLPYDRSRCCNNLDNRKNILKYPTAKGI